MRTAPKTFGLLPEFCRQNSPANQARFQTGTGWKRGKQTLPQGKSAACNYKKSSGSLTVKLLRPEITKAEWQDSDGSSASKGLVGDTLKLHAETKDMADGVGVRFCVYDSKTGEKVAEPAAKVDGNKADAEWTYHYDPSVTLKEKPKFYFTADAPRTKQKKSSDVEISGKITILLKNEIDYAIYGFDVSLIRNGDKGNAESVSFDSGKLEKEDLIPAEYRIALAINKKKSKEKSTTEDIPENCKEIFMVYGKFLNRDCLLHLEKTNILHVQQGTGKISE